VSGHLILFSMKKSLILVLILVSFISCKQNNSFYISGTVKDAAGKMLYIEHNGLLKTTVLDSTKLNADGEFSFKANRPKYPDFYRLRLNNKVITFAVDSCENISFSTQEKNFSTDYTVTGSTSSKQIQQLRKSVLNIQQKVDELATNLSDDVRNAKIAEIGKDIEVHKQMAQKLILENPRSTAAYFAIYQQVSNIYIFSPYDKSDKSFCAAVATSYNTFMPDYERSKNLCSIVIDAIRTERTAKVRENWNEILEKTGKGYIDIDLKDMKNISHKLSELEGKIVLLDFSAYASEKSVNYTFALRELYNKYHSRGFEIYQISLDDNKSLWEKSTENIPWICVRDENGSNATCVTSYNISSIPTVFLLDRKGNIITRSPEFEELKKIIEKNL